MTRPRYPAGMRWSSVLLSFAVGLVLAYALTRAGVIPGCMP